MDPPKEGCWLWVGSDPVHRLLLAVVVGPRVQEFADELIQRIDSTLDRSNGLPLFASDGFDPYRIAPLNMYGETIVPPRTGKVGRPKKPYRVPLSGLKYGQVVKEQKGGKINKIYKRVVFGNENDLPLSAITTSLIERQNLTFRQENERLARKTLGFSKDVDWLRLHSMFYQAFFNFVRTHAGLKVKIPNEERPSSGKKYIERTPMMACGKTDHVWTLEEMLSFPYFKTSVD